ncbi:hypothetical protein K469DRAFT_796315 [Zopfia rhizophila CBS 207.26]|uniref:Uncharacterized protein n=1 Tax=Zopfia rhizophila CBS 207.26 TaxID=1314779 RepID=A0A6A6DKY8_9PEZI|nr:hypothetical protein K469DRAFT_796315 [Zopfia rhizophila CBS 207.26]
MSLLQGLEWFKHRIRFFRCTFIFLFLGLAIFITFSPSASEYTYGQISVRAREKNGVRNLMFRGRIDTHKKFSCYLRAALAGLIVAVSFYFAFLPHMEPTQQQQFDELKQQINSVEDTCENSKRILGVIVENLNIQESERLGMEEDESIHSESEVGVEIGRL